MVLLRYTDAPIAPLLEQALATLSAQPGFVTGWLGRSPDDPTVWVLASPWSAAGTMRHGLGSYEAKIALGPLQAFSTGDDLVLEQLARADESGVVTSTSDRATDADSAGPSGSG